MLQTFLDSLTHLSLLTRFALALAVCLFVPPILTERFGKGTMNNTLRLMYDTVPTRGA